MKVLYVPLYRTAVSYAVIYGRRWSLLEQLILVELANNRRSTTDLAQLTDLPERLVIEALINLMRATWIEVRSTDKGALFAATPLGHKRATNERLPAQLQRAVRWISLCMDRLSGSWFRAEDLHLVYDRDLPNDAHIIEPRIHTYDPNDGALRELFHLNQDESLEPSTPNFKTPSRPYARVEVALGKVSQGLPSYSSLRLQQMIFEQADQAEPIAPQTSLEGDIGEYTEKALLMDDFVEDDILVGGSQQLDLLKACLENSKTHVLIHSCFVGAETVTRLLPDLESAARRKVRIDLLWGLHSDPEDPLTRNPISAAEKVLDRLPAALRTRVQLSPISSGSHAKLILYDDIETGKWISIIGSCNFLSSDDWIETSIRSRSQRLAEQLLARLIAAQLPASDSWSPTARRLNGIWSELRRKSRLTPEVGTHKITLLVDGDHYACVTRARDIAIRSVAIGCDFYGLSAETSVLVPMERAALMNRKVRLFYSRPSRFLLQEGRAPDPDALARRGMSISQVHKFHAKFLAWDDEALAITSFNWMSAVVDGARSRGAELGILVEGPQLRTIFGRKLFSASAGRVDISEI